MNDRAQPDAAAHALVEMIEQYRLGKAGRASVLDWLSEDSNLEALGEAGLGARQWLAVEVRKLLADDQTSDDEARRALGRLMIEYSRRRGEASRLGY